MKKLYGNLRAKIEKLQLAGASGVKLNFLKAALGVLKYAIILTAGAGNSFSLIFQTQGPKTIVYSYKEFKSYQKKVRLVFLLLAILALALLRIY